MRRLAAEGATTAVLLLLFLGSVFVVTSPAQASMTLTGKYIGAFLACNTSTTTCSNPQNHVTYLAESNDSIKWAPVPGFKPYSGSVPDAIRRGSVVYLYNPGTIVRFNLDTRAQTQSTSVSLKYSNGTSAIFVDPSVYLDSSGVLHLFYLPGIIGQDPASCPAGQSPCTKYIMSATELAGSDGGSFLVDSGFRAAHSVSGCCFSDPAVFTGPSGYYLYVSDGQAVLAFGSGTLTGSYSPVEGLSNAYLVPQGTGGVPAGYYDNASRSFWTYVSQGNGIQVIARASTTDINSSIGSSAFTTVISGCSFQGLGCSYTVGSPAIHLNSPGATSSTTSTSSATTSSITSSSSSSESSTLSSTSSQPATTTQRISTTSQTASSVSSQTSASSASSTSASPSTTSAGGGGIPEFPYQFLEAALFTALVAVSYLVIRTRGTSTSRSP